VVTTPGDALALNFPSYANAADDTTGILSSTMASFTLDLWFAGTGVGQVAGNLVSEWGQSGTYNGYNISCISLSNNNVYVGFWTGALYQLNVGTYIRNTWTHVAYTYFSGTITGYLNGVQIASASVTKSPPTTSYYALASYGNPYPYGTSCYIGAFKIYGTFLSSGQVKQNYNALAPHFGRPMI
jgi:hypothetical protein